MDRLETKFAAKKNRVILLGIILAFSLLIFRLFYLQILSNDLFSSQAQRNRMRFVEVEPKRGEILDANGVVLATSQPVYVVSMAGIKMYDAEDYPWMERKASKTQTYQVIHLSNDSKLKYEAYTIHGELYDAFELTKGADGRNALVNLIPDTPEYE